MTDEQREAQRRANQSRYRSQIDANYRFALNENIDESTVQEFSLGLMDQKCECCRALHFVGERAGQDR